MQSLVRRLLTWSAALVLIGSFGVAQAQPAPEAVRGTVSAISDTEITIKTKKGPMRMALTPDWSVQVTKPISVADIKEGSFVGTTNMPKGEGAGRSLEVHVFPPGVKIGEGHYSWNLRKGSMMTNGTVGKVTTAGKGRELEISYPNGKRKVAVPANVPVVQIVGGTRAMVRVGVPVFTVAFPGPAGGLITGSIAVGENGAKPPM